jgi:hypothetical protein
LNIGFLLQESWFATPSVSVVGLGDPKAGGVAVRLRHRCYRELDQSFGCRVRINVPAAASD